MTLPDITSKRDVRDLVRSALREDLGQGDVTSETLVAPKTPAEACILSRDEAVLSGVRLASYVFKCLDPRIGIRVLKTDGQRVQADEKVLLISGNARDILAGERVALNFLQRMSGIATLTRRFVEAKQETNKPEEGFAATAADGRVLNLDFKRATFRIGQRRGMLSRASRLESDTVHRHRADSVSGHQGKYRVGTYERSDDGPQARSPRRHSR